MKTNHCHQEEIRVKNSLKPLGGKTMSKIKKIFACLLMLGLLVSCGSSEIKKKDPYAALPPDVKEQVVKLDIQIKELQTQLEKNLRAFQKEEVEAQGEVFEEWQKFSESVKEGERFQDKANALREKIVRLQQQKVRLVENGFPQK